MVKMDIQAKMIGMAETDVVDATVGRDVKEEMRYKDGAEEAKSSEEMIMGLRACPSQVQ